MTKLAGRVTAAWEVSFTAPADAAVTLIVGTIHGEILPRVLSAPPGRPVTTEPGLAGRVADTVLRGIAPGPAR